MTVSSDVTRKHSESLSHQENFSLQQITFLDYSYKPFIKASEFLIIKLNCDATVIYSGL